MLLVIGLYKLFKIVNRAGQSSNFHCEVLGFSEISGFVEWIIHGHLKM